MTEKRYVLTTGWPISSADHDRIQQLWNQFNEGDESYRLLILDESATLQRVDKLGSVTGINWYLLAVEGILGFLGIAVLHFLGWMH